MIEELSYRWSHLYKDNLYYKWAPLGMLTGINRKSGLFNTKPFYEYLSQFMNDHGNKFFRKFVLSAVDVNTGSYVKYDETTPDPAKAAVSSSSIPFIFPTQAWDDGSVVMDGGVAWGTNIFGAIERCREIVDDDSQITIDVLTCAMGNTLEE
jgi:predicted patatin/cPLA2 family phospholipase